MSLYVSPLGALPDIFLPTAMVRVVNVPLGAYSRSVMFCASDRRPSRRYEHTCELYSVHLRCSRILSRRVARRARHSPVRFVCSWHASGSQSSFRSRFAALATSPFSRTSV